MLVLDYYGPVWYINLNICFQFLNNITHISTHFFTHTYFQKNWKLLFKHTYQTGKRTLNNFKTLSIQIVIIK